MTPNDKLPEEITKEIETQSEHHASVQWGDKAKFTNSFQYTNWANSADDYEDGATAWAPWKVKYDELHATIDDKIDKALHAERNAIQAKMTAMETGYLKQMQRMADALEGAIEQMKEYEQVFNVPFGTSIINGESALQQFKDGKGKEVQKPEPPLLLNTCGICKERPIGSGITVCDECYKNFDGDRRGFWNSETYQ